ncbi:MAG: hypothetical protein FP816_19725 [Desulfobacteraceae bacterium]|nr:hypothetical protein [Desulfobacteraceae bacterium]
MAETIYFADRIKETTLTVGTGVLVLEGPSTGFMSIDDGMGSGDAWFCCTDGVDWEVFQGHLDVNGDLTRDYCSYSSTYGDFIDWGAGTKEVFNVFPAELIAEMLRLSSGIKTEIFASSTGELTVSDCLGKLISNRGQSAENTQTLPDCEEGLSGTIVIATAGAGAFILEPGTNDQIYYNSVGLGDGFSISIDTPGIGNYLTFFSFLNGSNAWDWIVAPGPGTTVNTGGGP